jgi:toxin ParE1/3/4
MKIIWTEPAVRDLRELHAYIARDSEVYASGFVERIILATELLVEHPKAGRVVAETNDENVPSFSFNVIALSIASRRVRLKCCQ